MSNKFGAAIKFNARILITLTEKRVKNKSYCSPYRIVNDIMHSFDHTCYRLLLSISIVVFSIAIDAVRFISLSILVLPSNTCRAMMALIR